jgi:hypothetical protein
MFSDVSFLELLQRNLGLDSVPAAVVEYARKRERAARLPISDEMVDRLRERHGDIVSDSRARPE